MCGVVRERNANGEAGTLCPSKNEPRRRMVVVLCGKVAKWQVASRKRQHGQSRLVSRLVR